LRARIIKANSLSWKGSLKEKAQENHSKSELTGEIRDIVLILAKELVDAIKSELKVH